MMKAVFTISLGVCTVLLASACSSSLRRGTPPPPGPPSALSDRQGDGAAQAANVDRSQTDVDNEMRKRGYKPAIYRGERVYCRNEALTGSNLESKVCLTARQIEDQERSGKDILNRNRPAGCLPNTGCN
jgi:hypothetical protein